MEKKSSLACSLAILISYAMVLPPGGWADQPPQRAGEVSRVIPAVSIARGAKNITANAKTVVDWQDVVSTQANARARIALDDGSVLNVGSDSSLHIVKHDAAAQQTDLELAYGKLRSQAQKVTKLDGKFEVRTAAGVAGVVGTDFYMAYENNTMIVIVYEGIVRVCNLAGVCVEVKAGQMTSVRSGDNSAPLAPSQATLDLLTEAGSSTEVGGPSPNVATSGHHIGKGLGITLGILAVVPAVVIPVMATRGNNSKPLPTGCQLKCF
jgi:hypothetical protein